MLKFLQLEKSTYILDYFLLIWLLIIYFPNDSKTFKKFAFPYFGGAIILAGFLLVI